MSRGENVAIVLELVRLATRFPEMAEDFKAVAKKRGITEQQWEATRISLEEHNPQFLYGGEHVEPKMLTVDTSPETESSTDIYGQWMPLAPTDEKLNDGDHVYCRTKSTPVGKKIEFFVSKGAMPVGQIGVWLERVKNSE